jgi:hypothetical protein
MKPQGASIIGSEPMPEPDYRRAGTIEDETGAPAASWLLWLTAQQTLPPGWRRSGRAIFGSDPMYYIVSFYEGGRV